MLASAPRLGRRLLAQRGLITVSRGALAAAPHKLAPIADFAPPRRSLSTAVEEPAAPPPAARYGVMLEVSLSKIGPAGAGWWAANAYADQVMGYGPTAIEYFAITGAGDASAVFLGHSVYFILKSLIVPGISVAKELQTSFPRMLETQPFLYAAAGVGAACGSAFFVGLRAGRIVLPFPAVEGGTMANLKDDFALSVAIGGATGTFVGVVTDFADNPFIGTPIAILATASTLSGCFSSSQATILGFTAVQTVQNLFFPKGSNWIDGCLNDGTYKTP